MRPANNCRPAWQAPHLVAPGRPARGVTTTVIELRAGAATATIDPERGGRLAALRVEGRELLVGPPDPDDRSIRWGCFLMAPWPGRLAEGRLRFRGASYQLERTHGRHAIHGLVWSVPWTVRSMDGSSAELSAPLDGGGWPFGGEARESFRLTPMGLTIEATVAAGDRPMPAALGWHPWFRRDAVGDEPSLRIDAAALLERRQMLPTGTVIPASGGADLRAGPRLGRRRLDDAYVDAASPAILAGADRQLRIEFGAEDRTVVVFTPWNAVCIEPQTAQPNALGLNDDAARRAGRRDLEPGETLTTSMTIGWA